MIEPEALSELFKQQANISAMFRAFTDEFAKSVASGRQEAWFKAVRAYVDLVESSFPPIERRDDTRITTHLGGEQ